MQRGRTSAKRTGARKLETFLFSRCMRAAILDMARRLGAASFESGVASPNAEPRIHTHRRAGVVCNLILKRVPLQS
eukprot:2638302-Amphidinium_carterae.2